MYEPIANENKGGNKEKKGQVLQSYILLYARTVWIADQVRNDKRKSGLFLCWRNSKFELFLNSCIDVCVDKRIKFGLDVV